MTIILMGAQLALAAMTFSTSLRFPADDRTPESAPQQEAIDRSVTGSVGDDASFAPATGGDITVLVIRPPHGLVGGDGPHGYRVWLNSTFPYDVNVPVTVTVGGNAGSGTILVPAHSSANGLIYVNTPMYQVGLCGEYLTAFQVLAHQNYQDANPANDSAHSAVRVAAPYWDLEFELVNAPTNVFHCQWTRWFVRVTNVGNAPSMNVCAMTGIVLPPGPGNWVPNLGIQNFTTNNIAPGASQTFQFDYFVPCGALIGTQFVKTEINYTAGCFDYCVVGSNFDQQAVHVH